MKINSLQLFNRQRRRQTTEYLSNEDYSWIWEPFKNAKDSKLAQTACLAAEIIVNSSPDKIPNVPFNVDPRIVIPLCAIALQKDLNNLNQLNRVEPFSRSPTINSFLKIIQPSSRWRYLFNSLSPELQYQLYYRFSNYRLPSKNDWRNLFKDNSYSFHTSWHYYLMLALFLIIFFIAMIGMYSFIRIDVNILLNIWFFLSFIIFITFWVYLGKTDLNFTYLEYINYVDLFISFIWVFVSVVIGSLMRLLIEGIIEGLIGLWIGLLIGWLIGLLILFMIEPLKHLFISIFISTVVLSSLYFVHYTLISLLSLGWGEILIFWLTTLGIGGTLYWRGKTLDYEARNPLKGILDNTINN